MKNIFSQFNLKEYLGRRNALFQLRELSERNLLDCGFSLELLDKGVKAWPWQEQLDEETQYHVTHPINQIVDMRSEKLSENIGLVSEQMLQKDAA